MQYCRVGVNDPRIESVFAGLRRCWTLWIFLFRPGYLLLLSLSFAHSVKAYDVASTPRIITTIAGSDFAFPDTPIPAIDAPTGQISGVATDHNGNLYVSDKDNHLVLKIDDNGMLSVVAGNGIAGFSGDGG